MKILRGYYISAHRQRMDFFNWKWRLFVILLASLLVLFINDYLQAKYVGTVAFEAKADGSLEAAAYAMPDKLFNWFMTGVLFGIVALAVLYEGEFILGLRKMIARFEKQAETQFGRVAGVRQRKAVKQRRK
ncbi:MAG: hypothetical protein QXR53_01805 [Candidatus Norongarragalinales archaeon]